VLTIQEIKDGMRANNIRLMDDEWQKLVDVIDADCDGVLTCDEWVKVLDPKLDA
jgi:Ca2+-binding EF-hand superfamily protein